MDEKLTNLPAVFRNITTTPDTATARRSQTALLRAFTDSGYATIGRSVGHDKSWVSRWLSGESVANLPELLHMLDTAGLRIVHEDDMAKGNGSELVEKIDAALAQLSGIESALKAMEPGGELNAALLALARRALKDMQQEGSK